MLITFKYCSNYDILGFFLSKVSNSRLENQECELKIISTYPPILKLQSIVIKNLYIV